jgi:hypothetical protein
LLDGGDNLTNFHALSWNWFRSKYVLRGVTSILDMSS